MLGSTCNALAAARNLDSREQGVTGKNGLRVDQLRRYRGVRRVNRRREGARAGAAQRAHMLRTTSEGSDIADSDGRAAHAVQKYAAIRLTLRYQFRERLREAATGAAANWVMVALASVTRVGRLNKRRSNAPTQ